MIGERLSRADREGKRNELIKACFDHFDVEGTGTLPATRANALLITVGVSDEPPDGENPLSLADFQQKVLSSSTLKQAPRPGAGPITDSNCAIHRLSPR